MADIISQSELEELKSHTGKGLLTFDQPIEKIAPESLTAFAKENNIDLKQLAKAVVSNPAFNDSDVYTKGISAPDPKSTATGAQEVWKAFYQKYDIPPEIQQELYDAGVSIQVNKAGKEGARHEQGEKSTIYAPASALSGDMESLIPTIAHEVGHWYYYNQLDDQGRKAINDYFASQPEMSQQIKSVGEKQNYGQGMGNEEIGDEGFASSFLSGASTYGLFKDDTEKAARDMPQYFQPNWSNKYHKYEWDEIQSHMDEAKGKNRKPGELDIKTLGI